MRIPALAAIVLLLLSFGFILVRSVLRRAETTYRYPPYSSLNNSDEGVKAYFDALHRLGFNTSRNFKPLYKLVGAQADIFYCGPSLGSFRYSSKDSLREFEQIAEGGARLIIVFDPESTIEEPAQTTTPQKGSRKIVRTVENTLKTRWSIQLGWSIRPVSTKSEGFMKRLGIAPIAWHFSSWGNAWTPSHETGGAPLFLERSFGRGSILLIAGSKLFTNRQLLIHPDAELLASIGGSRREIIFDENHLGLKDTGTVVGLATAHGLQWTLLGFIVLAVFYVWHSSVPFVPAVEAPSNVPVSGHDAHSALSNLIMQSVPKTKLLGACAQEWNHTKALQRIHKQITDDEIKQLEHAAAPAIVTEYKALSAKLSSRVTL